MIEINPNSNSPRIGNTPLGALSFETNNELKPLPYQQIAQEIISVLRDSYTQRELSKQLGYSFNQVGKWESGVTKIKWIEFVNLAEKLKVPLNEGLSFMLNMCISRFDINKFPNYLMDSFGLVDLRNDKNVKRLKKWQKNMSQIHFADVLKILDSYPLSVFGWLRSILDCTKLKCVCQSYKFYEQREDAVAREPRMIFVNAALHLEVYKQLPRHDDHLLSTRSLVPLEDLQNILSEMTKLGFISYNGTHYVPCSFDFRFAVLPSKKLRPFNKYTALVSGLAYKQTPNSPIAYEDINISRSSHRVSAVSKKAAQEISDLMVKFHNQISDIVNSDIDEKTDVQIINFSSFASRLTDCNTVYTAHQLIQEDWLPKSK